MLMANEGPNRAVGSRVAFQSWLRPQFLWFHHRISAGLRLTKNMHSLFLTEATSNSREQEVWDRNRVELLVIFQAIVEISCCMSEILFVWSTEQK